MSTAIALLESHVEVTTWTWASILVGLLASTLLPHLVGPNPALAFGLGVGAAVLSLGVAPVLVVVGYRALRPGGRVVGWSALPVIGAVVGIGLGARRSLGLAPGCGSAALLALVCVGLVGCVLWRIVREQARETRSVDADWLSRRIHDGVGHRLALLGLRARVLSAHGAPTEVAEWNAVANEVEVTFDELRRLLDEIEARGELPDQRPGSDLDAFLDDAERAGVPVAVSGRTVLDGLDPESAELAVAVCREGVANAAKYAGPGDVRVILERDATGGVVATVKSPLGTPPPRLSGGGRGMRSLRTRLEASGGALVAMTDDGHYVLRARFPADRLTIVAADVG